MSTKPSKKFLLPDIKLFDNTNILDEDNGLFVYPTLIECLLKDSEAENERLRLENSLIRKMLGCCSCEKTTTTSQMKIRSPVKKRQRRCVGDVGDVGGVFKSGRWTKDEHTRFLEGLNVHSREWNAISDTIGTRGACQVRSHAQKYLKKLKSDCSSADKNI